MVECLVPVFPQVILVTDKLVLRKSLTILCSGQAIKGWLPLHFCWLDTLMKENQLHLIIVEAGGQGRSGRELGLRSDVIARMSVPTTVYIAHVKHCTCKLICTMTLGVIHFLLLKLFQREWNLERKNETWVRCLFGSGFWFRLQCLQSQFVFPVLPGLPREEMPSVAYCLPLPSPEFVWRHLEGWMWQGGLFFHSCIA